MIRRIVSGGQTGADRAALDAALEAGVPCGGWVPRERMSEEGPIPPSYPSLRETASADPAVRTELNVRDSSATLVLSHGPATGGTALTIDMARRLDKPHLHVDLDRTPLAEAWCLVREWVDTVRPEVLNVAGPRLSKDPEIYQATRALVADMLSWKRR